MNDGGAAFPTPDCSNWDGPSRTPGMSVRQYYKCAVLAAMLSSGNYAEPADVIKKAAKYADAMLAEDEEHTKK